MILPLAIATSALAVLSDDEDVDLDDKLQRAMAFHNPRIFFDAMKDSGATHEDFFKVARWLMPRICNEAKSFEEFERNEQVIINILDLLRHKYNVEKIFFKIERSTERRQIRNAPISNEVWIYDVSFLGGPSVRMEGNPGALSLIALEQAIAKSVIDFCEASVFTPFRVAQRARPQEGWWNDDASDANFEFKMLDELIEDLCSLTWLEMEKICKWHAFGVTFNKSEVAGVFASEKGRLLKKYGLSQPALFYAERVNVLSVS
jgi:hypothetical protein